MLSVKDLRVSYGKVAAVQGIDVTVTPGRVTILLGANGAGKTTSLRAIMGQLKCDSGEITLFNQVITGRATQKLVRKGLVMIPEGRRIFGPLSVEENLQAGAYICTRSALREGLERVYEAYPILYERRSKPAGFLSGGEQQMLALGRGLMSSPKIMLMDEPSLGLAPLVVESVLDSIRRIADSGVGVLLVEQNAELALDIADDVLVMARGNLSFAGDVAEASKHASIREAFLGVGSSH